MLDALARLYKKRLSAWILFRFIAEFVLFLIRSFYYLKILIRLASSRFFKWRLLSCSDDLSLKQTVLSKGSSVIARPPRFSGYGSRQVKKALQVDISFPALRIFEFADAAALGGIDFVFVKDNIIHHDFFDPLMHCGPAERFGIIRKSKAKNGIFLQLSKRPIQIEAGVCLIGHTSANYAHWLTEFLPKLALLDSLSDYNHVPLLIDKGLHPNILGSLELINLKGRQIIDVPQWVPVRADRLIVLSPVGYERYVPFGLKLREPAPFENVFSRAALLQLRKCIIAAIGDVPLETVRMVYLARSFRSKNLRQVSNVSAVEKLLDKFDVKKIQTQDMSFREQVLSCINANLIIGPIGASLANMIFAPPGCTVIILAPYYPDANYHFYANLALTLGHEIHFVLGKQVFSKLHPMHKDYLINENSLELVLRRVV